MRQDGTTLTDVLEVEAALAEPAIEEDAAPAELEALEDEPEAAEEEPEPEPEVAVAAAANFSTPPVNVTGTPANSLPEKLVVVTILVWVDVTPATSISTSKVT
jgi:hypothetical protein